VVSTCGNVACNIALDYFVYFLSVLEVSNSARIIACLKSCANKEKHQRELITAGPFFVASNKKQCIHLPQLSMAISLCNLPQK
jgi:hypothetical protein